MLFPTQALKFSFKDYIKKLFNFNEIIMRGLFLKWKTIKLLMVLYVLRHYYILLS